MDRRRPGLRNVNVRSLLLQVVNYTLFMAIVWYFSFQPPYRQLAEDSAVVTLVWPDGMP